jgi:ABC-type bacteriocin/lantibiotic exporter with double-glycine peptidase domain
MRILLIAALLITLPAIVAIIVGLSLGHLYMVWGALASLLVNMLPFTAAYFIIRNRSGGGMDMDAH